MLREIAVEMECDECGQSIRLAAIDAATRVPVGWTLFDVAMDTTRWHGEGHVYADGRWYCDACDNAAAGHPGGEDPDEAAGPAVVSAEEAGELPQVVKDAVRDLETTRELAAAAGRHAEDLRNLLRQANEALDAVVGWAALTHEYWDANADHKVGKRLNALAGVMPGYAAEIDAVHAFRMRLKDALAGFIPYQTDGGPFDLGTYRRALAEANRRLEEIRDELCGREYRVVGFHANGATEGIERWFDDNEWDPVGLADYTQPSAAPADAVGGTLQNRRPSNDAHAENERLRLLLRRFGDAERELAVSEDGVGCENLIDEHVRTYEAVKREAVRISLEAMS